MIAGDPKDIGKSMLLSPEYICPEYNVPALYWESEFNKNKTQLTLEYGKG